MPVSGDLRAIMRSASSLGAEPTAVTLASGQVVQGRPGHATANDTMLGTGNQVCGDERTLTFVSADVPGLKPSTPLTWNGQRWRVKLPQLMANGLLVKAFLEVLP